MAGDDRPVERGPSAPDRRAVPAAAVLVLQQDRLAVGPGARGEAGGGELEQSEQAGHLSFPGQQRGQGTGQPDRLVGEVGAQQPVAAGRRRTLGEEHVEHAQYPAEALAPLLRRRHREGDAGGGDGLLGPGDPGLEGGHRHQEGAGDLLAGQPGDHPQGQRRAGLGRQYGVAGDEHQREHVVLDQVRVPRQVVRAARGGIGAGTRPALGQPAGEGGVALVEGGAAAVPVDGAAPAGGEQPADRVGRFAVARPGDQRLGHGLLGDVLGEVEVAGEAGEGADDARRLDPPHGLDGPPGGLGAVAPIKRPGKKRPGIRCPGIRCPGIRCPGIRCSGRSGRPGRACRPVRGLGAQSCPVRSRHARSLTIHSLSWGNSSMLGTRRISTFVPGKAGSRFAQATASSCEATSRM